MSAAGFHSSTDGITRTLALVATGTAPEIRQYLCLAKALQSLGGFRVRFVSHGAHAPAAAAAGLAFASLRGDATAVLRTSAFRDAIATGNMLGVAKLFKADADANIGPNMPLILAACRDLDGILCSIGVLTECLAVGQKFQRPVVLLPLLPYSPSGELPLAHVFSQPAKYAFLNKFSYDLSGTLLWAVMGATYNKFRTQTLAIGPQAGYELQGVPQVCGFSHLVVPRPSDWGEHIRTTGHWAEEGDGGGGRSCGSRCVAHPHARLACKESGQLGAVTEAAARCAGGHPLPGSRLPHSFLARCRSASGGVCGAAVG